MRLTLEILHHTLTFTAAHDEPEDEPEQHDSTLDALVERAGSERDTSAELDTRTRMGFK